MAVTHTLRSSLGTALALGAALGLAGCYQYYPTQPELTPSRGTDIRATLAAPTPFDLGTETIHDVTRVEGTLVDPGRDSLGVWVNWLRIQQGPKFDGNRAQFYLQRGNIKQLEAWRFSPRRTLVATGVTGAIVAGFYGLLKLAGVAANGGGSHPPQGY
jgi:hypothetical protein